MLFSIWCGNKNLWHYKFQEIDNPFIRALTDGCNDVDNRKTLETIQDGVWQFCIYIFLKLWDLEILLVLENILAALFESVYQVQSVIYTCRHNHVHRMNNSYSLVLMHGAGHYNSTMNGLYEERMKHAMCVQLVMKEFLSNIAIRKTSNYLILLNFT